MSCRSTFIIAAALEMGAAMLALILYCRTSQLYGGRRAGALNEDRSDDERFREQDELEHEALEPSTDCHCHVHLVQHEDRTGHGT